MKLITVISQQEDGLLAKVTEILAKGNINIEALEATDIDQWSLIHLDVDRYNEALTLLRDADINAITEDAIVTEITDEPGALARVTKRLHDAHIIVHSVRILHRQNDKALVAIATEDNDKAQTLLG